MSEIIAICGIEKDNSNHHSAGARLRRSAGTVVGLPLNRAAAIIDDVRSELAPDSRQSICEVRAFTDPDGVLVLEVP